MSINCAYCEADFIAENLMLLIEDQLSGRSYTLVNLTTPIDATIGALVQKALFQAQQELGLARSGLRSGLQEKANEAVNTVHQIGYHDFPRLFDIVNKALELIDGGV